MRRVRVAAAKLRLMVAQQAVEKTSGECSKPMSELSRRDNRTQPGVLTPGRSKSQARPERAADGYSYGLFDIFDPNTFLPPFQGGLVLASAPGVKTPG